MWSGGKQSPNICSLEPIFSSSAGIGLLRKTLESWTYLDDPVYTIIKHITIANPLKSNGTESLPVYEPGAILYPSFTKDMASVNAPNHTRKTSTSKKNTR